MKPLPKPVKITLLVLGGLFLFLVVAFVSMVAYARHVTPNWPAPLPDVQVEPTRPFLAEEDVTADNAYFYLRQLAEVDELPDELADWDEEWTRFDEQGLTADAAYPALDAALEYFASDIQLMVQAAGVSTCQVATVASPDAVYPYTLRILKLVRLLNFEAHLHADQGDWVAADDSLSSALANSLHLQRGGGMIHYLVGVANLRALSGSLREMRETHTELPRSFMEAWIPRLLTTDQAREPFAEAMRYEALFAMSCVDMAYAGGNLTGLSGTQVDVTQWNGPIALLGSTPEKTRAHFRDAYAHQLRFLQQPYDVDAELPLESFLTERSPLMFLAEDPIGRILLAIVFPALDGARVQDLVTSADLRATAVALALELYARDHDGAYPATLDVLVPTYLDSLPADPFASDHAPFRYQLEAGGGWLLYSLGKNQTDNGGDPGDSGNDHRSPDLVFRSDEMAQRAQLYR